MRSAWIVPLLLGAFASSALADEIGSVSTKFKWMGPNDKIVVEVFQDDDIPGVVCYLSRAKTGGVSGAVGVAEDTSDSSIECTQIGPIALPDDVRSGKRNGEQVFKKRTSLLFKSLQVVRFYDGPRNALVYLSYSDRIIEGSPKNSISAVAIQPWKVEPVPPAQAAVVPPQTAPSQP
ncbi:CreA protein [Allochromatium warmingii]|uniref:CreA protein n=1 Tax=Allochromatium warmingii TaxID=61595 RepID=A0A1H3E3E6_ALLWA|nr:CreA family protein [Allochromatium warmingii]SDX72828.1 CreA protein [Allochromatium warmingii]